MKRSGFVYEVMNPVFFFGFLQVVNFRNVSVSLKISVDGLQTNSLQLSGATKTVLTSSNVMDENSFKEPTKVFSAKSHHCFTSVMLLYSKSQSACSFCCFLGCRLHHSDLNLKM